MYPLVCSPKDVLFLFSSVRLAFIPLLSRQAPSLYYTCYSTEVKNYMAGIAQTTKRETKRGRKEENEKQED